MAVAADLYSVAPAEAALALIGGDAVVVVQALAIGLVGDEARVGRERRVDHGAVDGEYRGEEGEHNAQHMTALQPLRSPRGGKDGWAHWRTSEALEGFWN